MSKKKISPRTETTNNGDTIMTETKTRKPAVRLKQKTAAEWTRLDDNKVLAQIERVLSQAPTAEIRRRLARQAVELCQEKAYDTPAPGFGEPPHAIAAAE